MLLRPPSLQCLIFWRAAVLRTLAGAAITGIAACSHTPADSEAAHQAASAPETASGWSPKPGWVTRNMAVASANPLATEAGLRILHAGGTALDAAIAVQMVLTLVEPQSSGIGGGALLLHAKGPMVQAYDGRETAARAASENLFLQANGQPMTFEQAITSGRAVGVPGAVRMLELAHQEHGKLPWSQLFQPAIDLAQQGFAISPRLHRVLSSEKLLRHDPVARAYFYTPQGKPWPVGHRLKNPELAHVLRAIATEGARALHTGPIAQAIVSAVQTLSLADLAHSSAAQTLSLADLAGYSPRKRSALCYELSTLSSKNLRVCGFPPPSSGAIAMGQILGILANTPAQTLPLGEDSLPSAQWLHYYSEASRLAFADRAQYLADPDFVAPPAGSWLSLLNPSYLAQRAQLIGPYKMPTVTAGNPSAQPERMSFAPMAQQPEYGTSHISIVDAHGNALALTTSIEDQFGSRKMVNTSSEPARSGGFLLNNQLTDFSFKPSDASGLRVANRVEPTKRPRSSMSPTLVFDSASGELLASTGSPGGANIIHYTTKALYAAFHWGLRPQQAIDMANFGNIDGPLMLEKNYFPAATVKALQARGNTVEEREMTSGLQLIVRDIAQPLWLSGSDPRREGMVMGDAP